MNVIIKLGGSVITDKSEFKRANLDNINRLVSVISDLHKEGIRFMIVHGAGSYAHIPAKKYNLSNGYHNSDIVKYSEVHNLCEELSVLITGKLIDNDIPAVQFHPSSFIIQKDKKPIEIHDGLLWRYLKEGFVPVMHGDVVLDNSINSSIISGDELMKHYGNIWADKLVFVSDVDGLLDKFPRGDLIPVVSRDNVDEVIKSVSGSHHIDVTGGMAGKISDLINLRVPTYLVNGHFPDRIKSAVYDVKDIYTKFEV